MKHPACLAIALCLLALTGCTSFESRTKEKSATFATLDPQTQSRLKEGLINVGDTFDMVYIALGAPDEKRQKLADGASRTVWTYNNYWEEYRGSAVVGYRRVLVQNPQTKTYRVYFEPIRESIYEQRSEERIRVTFQDGKVTVVEQAKRD